MSKTLDLNLIPVACFAGNDQTQFVGLQAADPPRRTARGRGADRLVLYLGVVGNAPLPPAKQERLLADLAELYFQTAGSVTSGMRAVARALNESLLDRNLQLSNSGRQGIGLLTQFVLREDQAYLGLSGPVSVFLIAAQDTQEFYDPTMEGKGLGQSRTPLISYHQTRLQERDTLILAAQPGSEWNPVVLAGLYGQGPQSLRRKLFPQNIDVHAVLIQARPGKGKFYVLRPQASVTDQSVAELEDQPAPQTESPGSDTPPGIAVAPMVAISGEAPVQAALPGTQADPEPASQAPEEFEATVAEPGFVAMDTTSDLEKSTSPRRSRPDFSPVGRALAAVGLPILNAFQKVGEGIGALLERLIPEGLSSSVMAFIAIAVPVVVVTVASVTYSQLGRSARFEALYMQAEQKAAEALAQEDIEAPPRNLEATALTIAGGRVSPDHSRDASPVGSGHRGTG